MQWIADHFTLILGIALAVSEALAAIVQMVVPENKGISGVLAGIIKFLQGMKQPKELQ